MVENKISKKSKTSKQSQNNKTSQKPKTNQKSSTSKKTKNVKVTKKNIKNKLNLAIIGIVAMIILVAGATYAYFSVGVVNNFGTSNVNITAENLGSVVLNGTSANLNMELSAMDMMKRNAGTYFASSSGKTRIVTEERVGTASVIPTEDVNNYECTVNLNITHSPSVSGNDDLYDVFSDTTKYASKSKDQIYLMINGKDYDWYDGMPSTIEEKIYLTGEITVDITAGLRFINSTSIDQSALAGHDININISVPNNGISCKAVEDINVLPENAVYLSQQIGTIYYSSMDDTTKQIANAALARFVSPDVTYDILPYGGNKYPSNINNIDAFLYEDYAYQYFESIGGWGVALLDNSKTSYRNILSSINNMPVKSVEDVFSGCTNLVTAPVIPSSVINMRRTFDGCTSLVNAPTIPNSVINMERTFYDCTSLEIPPTIGINVENMKEAFKNCTSLTSAPTIPNSVTDMQGTFYDNTNLGGKPIVNANPSSYSGAFKNTQITGIGGSTNLKSQLYATK